MRVDQEHIFYKKVNKINDVYTHSGKFHADDVFSYALLHLINPDLTLHRVSEILPEYDGIVFDIGAGEFDHHQIGARVRENQIPYAAFGLLWEQAGTIFFSEKSAHKFDEKFVQSLDLNDNTGEPDTIAMLIGEYNPSWNQKKDLYQEFLQASVFAEQILIHKIEHMQANEEADDKISSYLEKAEDKILVLDSYIPFKKAVEDTDIAFVVFPSDRGGYNAMTVKDPISKEAKVDFCKMWYGKSKDELVTISGIATLRFCHKSGFMIATDTVEDAIAACKVSISSQAWIDKCIKQMKYMRNLVRNSIFRDNKRKKYKK